MINAVMWLFGITLLTVCFVSIAKMETPIERNEWIKAPLPWGKNQCPLLASYSSVELKDCKRRCQDLPECNAINYAARGGHCVLLGCPLPLPQPQWKTKSFKGYFYFMKSDIDEMMAFSGTVRKTPEFGGQPKIPWLGSVGSFICDNCPRIIECVNALCLSAGCCP